jgi:hypothetical protein
MKEKRPKTAELESELVRLTNLVRERRKTLVRLDKCPNTDCECRRVWREVVEKDLAGQVGKVRAHVKPRAAARNGAGKVSAKRKRSK